MRGVNVVHQTGPSLAAPNSLEWEPFGSLLAAAPHQSGVWKQTAGGPLESHLADLLQGKQARSSRLPCYKHYTTVEAGSGWVFGGIRQSGHQADITQRSASQEGLGG